MDIIIRNSGGVPIYDQITRQMKGLILRGELKEGEALPSMRLLAKELQGGRGPALHAAAGQGAAHFRHHHQAGL